MVSQQCHCVKLFKKSRQSITSLNVQEHVYPVRNHWYSTWANYQIAKITVVQRDVCTKSRKIDKRADKMTDGVQCIMRSPKREPHNLSTTFQY